MSEVNNPKAASDVSIYSVYTDLKLMRDIALTCVRCDLAKTRTQVVFGEGPFLPPGQVGVMLVGEAPGEDEDKQGRPFVGRSGKLLNSLLEQAGLKRESIWISNTNKCRPVLIEGKSVKNRAPTAPEQKACEIWWHNEIELLKPQIVLCLGATAAKKILDNKNFKITQDRGKWFAGPKDTEVLVSFHPSYVMRQQGAALLEIKETVVQDFREVVKRLEALRAGNAPLQTWQKPAKTGTDDGADDGQLSMF
jgi:uracil-DNA glycosylase